MDVQWKEAIEEQTWVLGIDGGGTKTVFAACDLRGTVLGLVETGGTNPRRITPRKSAAIIKEGVTALEEQVSLDRTQCASIYAGIAGFTFDQLARSCLTAALAELGFACPITVEGDLRCAWAGATGFAPGIVVGAGTGSFAYGEVPEGASVLVGGWGPHVGDDGSGFALGRDALKACCKAVDGTGPATVLVEMIIERLTLASMRSLADTLQGSQNATALIASLTELVFQAFRQGDGVAEEIIKRGAAELVQAAMAVRRRLFAGEHRVDIFPLGSVFTHQPSYVDLFQAKLREVSPGDVVKKPLLQPYEGALLLALRDVRAEHDWDTVLANLSHRA